MTTRAPIPDSVRSLVTRVLTSTAAQSSPDVRRAVFEHVAALARTDPNPPAVPAALETYVRKVALNAYKVLDREVDALRTAGYTVDDIFEITVTASVAAGVARMETALAALEDAK